ncbi:MAG: hypothetical protein RL357_1315 [Pseudomonadota bacterium]
MLHTRFVSRLLISAALVLGSSAWAADTMAKLRQLLPQLPADAEVMATPIKGIMELRVGNDVMYVDESGQFLIQGALIDLKSRINLTEARTNDLLKIPFKDLPVKDGFVIKRGNGKRQLVIFEDPNCGYCKRLERDMASMGDITITVMLLPVLGPDSSVKSKGIWCAKDPAKAWEEWMLDGIKPPAAKVNCDTSALDRNLEFGRKHRITGTPTLFFVDGSRVPGAVPAAEIDKRLNELHP